MANLFEWAENEKTKPRYVAFDLEIAKEMSGDDWKKDRPLGITCAATYQSDGEVKTWHGVPQMSQGQCCRMADYLIRQHVEGYTLVTWNGLGFDLDVLAEECYAENYVRHIAKLAMEHIDIGFSMLCDKGFMVGLNTAALGMGLSGKTEGMHGDLAPVMWKGTDSEREKVLEYVAQDAKTTGEVYEAIIEKGRLRWTSRSGRTNFWVLGNGKPKSVLEALKVPMPDTSWMGDPSFWAREKFYEWTGHIDNNPNNLEH